MRRSLRDFDCGRPKISPDPARPAVGRGAMLAASLQGMGGARGRSRWALICFGVATVCGAVACRSKPASPPWVLVTGVAQRRATVVWRAGDEQPAVCVDAASRVHLGVAERRQGGIRALRLEGLDPDSTYRCSVRRPRGRALHVRFRTAPGRQDTVTFAVVGDAGDGSTATAGLARRILAGRPAFLLHLGDLAADASDERAYDRLFFQPYRHTLSRVPFFALPGSRDLRRCGMFAEVLAPHRDGVAQVVRQFDWGPVHFGSVASRRLPDLADGLNRWGHEQNTGRESRPWQILCLHEPIDGRSRNFITPRIRTLLAALLARARVDLVLAAHERSYARSEVIPARAVMPGLVEIVSGGGGVSPDPAPKGDGTARAASAAHYLRIRVTPEQLDVRAIDLRGHSIDHFRMARHPRMAFGVRNPDAGK